MRHKFVTATIAFLSCLIATAQTIVSTSEEYDATPVSIISNSSGSMLNDSYTHSYKRAVLYTGSNEAVMLLKKRKQDGGNLVKINSTGKILWDVTIKDAVLFFGLYNNNIIVLTVPDWNDGNENVGLIQSIKVTLINMVKGTASAEKILWQGTPDVYIDPKVLSLKDGTFKGLLLRYTNARKKRYNSPVKEYDEKGHATKLEWLNYPQSLEQPIVLSLTGNAISDEFLGCDVNSKGELFVVTCTNSAIAAEKYSANASAPVSKAITYYEAHEEARKSGTVSCNPAFDEQVSVAFRYRNPKKDYSLITANFDLAAGKGYNYVTELTKDYRKQLDLRNADDMQVREILFYKDMIIVAKEIEIMVVSGNRNISTRFSHLETLLSVYDSQMKLKKDIIVPRSLVLFIPAQMNGGYHLDKNTLTMLANETGKGANVTTKMATIDLDQLTVTSNNIVDRGSVSKSALIEAEAALWFNGKIILPYIVEHGFGGRNDRTAFQILKL